MIATDRITVGHRKRNAYLYVRQSTLYQTEQNPESLQRQYDVRKQALSLGWHEDLIVTLDEDLGQSGAEATHRADFQRLVADVGLGQVGVVLSLEISRLARNSADWHRLLELCAMTDTLILDEAVAALDSQEFDLVLMDAKMPEMDGLEATAMIRAKENRSGGHIPIVAMTAHAMKGDREKWLEAGADEYISKPIRAKSLFDAIETVLGNLGRRSLSKRHEIEDQQEPHRGV